LEFIVPFQHKYGYIRDEPLRSTQLSAVSGTVNEYWPRDSGSDLWLWRSLVTLAICYRLSGI